MEIDADQESLEYQATSYSTESGTPAPSVYSYSSSRDGQVYLRELGGRTLNAKNDLYLLPADEYEHSRLDKQHFVHLLSVGGLYMAKEEVDEALKPIPGVPRAILDLGCGGGVWATSMAQEFPHAQIVGVDLAPTTTRPPPSNCRFEFDDFTLGLEHYYNSFDVVHCRSIANGVKDYKWLINETAKCVKHGGVLIYVEGNFEIMNEQRLPQEIAFGKGAPGQSWLARMCFEAYNSMKIRGSALDAGIMLERWMNESPDLGPVKYDTKWIPLGPWLSGSNDEENRILIAIGTLMRQNMKEFAKSLVPVFVAGGFAPELINRFVEGTNEELDALDFHMYLRYHHCWARRVTKPDPEECVLNTDVRMDFDENPSSLSGPVESSGLPNARSMSPIEFYGSPSPPPAPGPRAVRVVWKTNPETGEKFLDTESLMGSVRSMGTASMSISSTSSISRQQRNES